MKIKTITSLLALVSVTSLSASIAVTVENNVFDGTASGGSGTGTGTLTTDLGSISSVIGLPVTTYTVSDLDFTSLGGTATESFTFTMSFAATSDGSTPASTQFSPFGNIGVIDGSKDNFVDGTETLTATISLTSTTFAGLSLDGFVKARAGGASGGRTGKLDWATGSFDVSTGNTVANIDPLDSIAEFTLTAPTSQLNLEGFTAQFSAAAIPEPSSLPLFAALGLAGVVLLRRRKA